MYIIPEQYSVELKSYADKLDLFLNEQINPLDFKIERVYKGIYEQRTNGTYMVRIRCAGGVISGKQMLGIAELASKYNSKILHITTRQELQFHNINLEDTSKILDELHQIGISTKGSGGNTVRNILCSADSVYSENEIFNPSPHTIALTNYLISQDISWDLPRKFKIAFSNSSQDNTLACFNDLGFIAKEENGQKGFSVYIGGSPSNKAMIGKKYSDFIPENKIFHIAEGVIQYFNEYGNRKNRHKARLRYLFYKHGKEKVFGMIKEKIESISRETDYPVIEKRSFESAKLDIKPLTDEKTINSQEYKKWYSDFVKTQKQTAYVSIEIPVLFGNLNNKVFSELASYISGLSANDIRFTVNQNILLQNIPENLCTNIYSHLKKIRIETALLPIQGNLVSCTGADTCQLGICFSKGALKKVYDRLESEELSSDKLDSIRINISGCPNGCGQHLVSDLGFAGKVSRKEKLYPAYTVFAGGISGEDKADYAFKIGEVSAKDLPDFTYDMLKMYSESEFHNFPDFIQSQENEIAAIFYEYKNIPSFEEDPSYYKDWGNNTLFSLEGRGTGECSAGLLDMIEIEIKNIKQCKLAVLKQPEEEQQLILLTEIFHSSLKLALLTKKITLKSEDEIIKSFKTNFLFTELLDPEYTKLCDFILSKNEKILEFKKAILQLADDLFKYYDDLDDDLKVSINEISTIELKQLIDTKADFLLIDYREEDERLIASLGGKAVTPSQLKSLPAILPKEKKVVFYCRTGRRSSDAILYLHKNHGFNNLYNLTGGIHSWADTVDKSIIKY